MLIKVLVPLEEAMNTWFSFQVREIIFPASLTIFAEIRPESKFKQCTVLKETKNKYSPISSIERTLVVLVTWEMKWPLVSRNSIFFALAIAKISLSKTLKAVTGLLNVIEAIERSSVIAARAVSNMKKTISAISFMEENKESMYLPKIIRNGYQAD
jgi:hypothetical protein